MLSCKMFRLHNFQKVMIIGMVEFLVTKTNGSLGVAKLRFGTLLKIAF